MQGTFLLGIKASAFSPSRDPPISSPALLSPELPGPASGTDLAEIRLRNSRHFGHSGPEIQAFRKSRP